MAKASNKKVTAEFDKKTYKDLLEIAGLCKEAPEELLARAFREWVDLREDLYDVTEAERILATTKPEDWVPLEDVIRDLEQRESRAKKSSRRSKQPAQ